MQCGAENKVNKVMWHFPFPNSPELFRLLDRTGDSVIHLFVRLFIRPSHIVKVVNSSYVLIGVDLQNGRGRGGRHPLSWSLIPPFPFHKKYFSSVYWFLVYQASTILSHILCSSDPLTSSSLQPLDSYFFYLSTLCFLHSMDS